MRKTGILVEKTDNPNLKRVFLILGAICEESLARFASAEKLKAISFLDNDLQGKRVLDRLRKDKLIQIISVNDLKKDAVTIEDLVPKEMYVKAVNSVYSRLDNRFVVYNKNDNIKTGIVEEIHKYLKTFDYELDKVAVARELISTLEINDKTKELFDPFTELFTRINKAAYTSN